MILFLGIGAATYAQSEASAPADKKDAPKAQIVTDQNATAKTGCTWVDANNDGKCDNCGKTAAECKEKCAPAPKKEGCSSSCPMHKECGQTSSPSKDGKKNE